MTTVGKFSPWAVILSALALLVAHISKWDKLQVDTIALALLGLILIVPLMDFVRKIRIGEFEAEIAPREVARARAKVSSDLATGPRQQGWGTERYSSVIELARQDPQLGLAKLRIDLEQSLRALHSFGDHGGQRRRSAGLGRLAEDLARRGQISPQLAAALRDVIPLVNRAIHGEYVRTQDAGELAVLGTQLLEELKLIMNGRGANRVGSDLT